MLTRTVRREYASVHVGSRTIASSWRPRAARAMTPTFSASLSPTRTAIRRASDRSDVGDRRHRSSVRRRDHATVQVEADSVGEQCTIQHVDRDVLLLDLGSAIEQSLDT